MLVGIKDEIADDYFFNLHNYLTPGDLIIFNDSKVLSSRMIHIDNNVNKEIFIEKILSEFEAFCLLGNFKGLNQGDNYLIGNDLEFTYLSSLGSLKHLRFKHPIEKLISSFGQIPCHLILNENQILKILNFTKPYMQTPKAQLLLQLQVFILIMI